MTRAGRLLIILLLAAASLSEGAANPLLEDVSGDLERRLAAGVDGLEVAGRRLNREMLGALYRARNFEPLWIEAKGATHDAKTLFDVMSAAEAEGLNPADCGPDAIRQKLADADPARLAELELLLSSGLARYGTDLQAGRLAPKKVDPSLFVYVRDVDPLALLESAGAAPDLARSWRDLAPSNPYYRRLRQVLAEHRRLAQGGGWPTLPDGPNLRSGESGPRVVILRERLGMGAGSLAGGADAILFDEEVEAAVRRRARSPAQCRPGVLFGGEFCYPCRRRDGAIRSVPADTAERRPCEIGMSFCSRA